MELEKTLVEYKFEDNVVSVVERHYINSNRKRIKDYAFRFGNVNNSTSFHSRYKTVGGALRKFNKAVKSINEGVKIK